MSSQTQPAPGTAEPAILQLHRNHLATTIQHSEKTLFPNLRFELENGRSFVAVFFSELIRLTRVTPWPGKRLSHRLFSEVRHPLSHRLVMPFPLVEARRPANRPLRQKPNFHDSTSEMLRHLSCSSLAEAEGNRLLSYLHGPLYRFQANPGIEPGRQGFRQERNLRFAISPNDVCGQAFRTLLDPKCATPFCSSPSAGTKRSGRTPSPAHRKRRFPSD